MSTRDWSGAGFTRKPAVPRGPVRALAYFCGAVWVRAYDIDCGAGAGPRAVSYYGPLRACIAYMRSNAVQCGPMFNIAFNFVIEKIFPFIKARVPSRDDLLYSM